MSGAQILLAYDNFMHYTLLTHPFGGGSGKTSTPTSTRPDDGARPVTADQLAAKIPDKVHRVEQSIDSVKPTMRQMLQGL